MEAFSLRDGALHVTKNVQLYLLELLDYAELLQVGVFLIGHKLLLHRHLLSEDVLVRLTRSSRPTPGRPSLGCCVPSVRTPLAQ